MEFVYTPMKQVMYQKLLVLMDQVLLMLELVREELIRSSLYLIHGSLYQDLLVLLSVDHIFTNLEHLNLKVITNLIMV